MIARETSCSPGGERREHGDETSLEMKVKMKEMVNK